MIVQNAGASSPFLLVCDHAGRDIPHRLGTLGLPPGALDRHIAYDLGALALSKALAERLGACLIRQSYSRLVIDCNRDPARLDAMPTVADGTAVPGNVGLAPADIQARVREIHSPYHAAISAELAARAARNLPTVLVLVHSFTPHMAGVDRPWQVGVLHQGNALSHALLPLLQAEPGLVVGDNQPYAMDEIDFTAPLHAGGRGLEYAELETRQDLIADAAGQARYADLYARLLPRALAAVG